MALFYILQRASGPLKLGGVYRGHDHRYVERKAQRFARELGEDVSVLFVSSELDERAEQARWADFRITRRGEWFYPAAQLLAYYKIKPVVEIRSMATLWVSDDIRPIVTHVACPYCGERDGIPCANRMHGVERGQSRKVRPRYQNKVHAARRKAFVALMAEKARSPSGS